MVFTRRTCLKTLSGAALAAAFPASAWAHKERTTVTELLWNPQDKLLEITHLYHMHDAEVALSHVGIIDKPDLTSLKARAHLALYTEKHFALENAEGEPLPLELIGAEWEGRSVYVYQQVPLTASPKSLKVSCTLLRDIIEGQINNVDLNIGGEISSIQFRGEDKEKSIPA